MSKAHKQRVACGGNESRSTIRRLNTVCTGLVTGMTILIMIVSYPVWGATLAPTHAHVPKLQTGDLHALVVGVSKYGNPNIPSLSLADKDAKAFGEFLESQKKVFKNTRVTFLLNEKATKCEVEKYLYYTLHKAGKDDTIILFFSGHGAYDPMRPQDLLFLTHDSEPDYLRATSVKMSGLDFLKGIEAERVLIIADACHAGGFSEMKPKATLPTVQQFLSEARRSSGRAIITSGKEDQLSWEIPNLNGSVFTHNLIQGLRGKADKDHDGVVTLNEAYQYAYDMTRKVTKGHQHPQFEGKVVGAFPLSYVGQIVPPAELKKRLLLSAKTCDAGKTEMLLRSGVDVDTRDEENNTALIMGAGNGCADVVRLLADNGADLEARNQCRNTALGAACDNGKADVVKLLLDLGANLKSKNSEGLTPLALACRGGHLHVVKLCLDAGADVKSRTKAGKTPLILASSEGHADVVKLLMERGADIGAKDLEGATAWTEAARRGHLPIVKFLVQMGANVAAISGAFLDSQLVLATLHNDLVRAKELLMLGAKPDATTESGDSVLALAAGLGHLKLIEYLVEKGANVNLRIRGNSTALLLAARSGRTKVVELLLAKGAYPDATDKDGNTSLSLAARHGYGEIVTLLLAKKADLNARNKHGSTALTLAAEHGHLGVVRLLLAADANIRTTDADGNTAMIVSARNGHLKVVRLLCAEELDLNARNSKGQTALLLAAMNGHSDIVKLLLSRGADASVQDWEGKTAFVVAAELGRVRVLNVLARFASKAVAAP